MPMELWVFGQELGSSGQGRESVSDSLHAAAVFLPNNSVGLDLNALRFVW